jgi:hypothetical protein
MAFPESDPLKPRKLNPFWLGPALLVAMPMWCQQPAGSPDQSGAPVSNQTAAPDAGPDNGPAGNNSDRMLAPPLVSGQSFPMTPTSEERSNYLRGGVTFQSAYSDNVLGATTPSGTPISDISYSVAPTVALDQTTTRLHWTLSYAPGFTFYQRETDRNEADENASIDFQYRLSPHVTLSARDALQKSSSVFNQPDLGSGTVAGGTGESGFSVIAPIADRLGNAGNVDLFYQFALNEMIGAGGTFSNLHFPNPSEVPGIYDSESQGGSAFYAYRVSKVHYIGASYQYQRLLSFPSQGQNQTQTHAALFFYALCPSSRFSISLFGGPQYADIGPQFAVGVTTPVPASRMWTPAAGGSMNWQGRFTSLAVSYVHMISSSSGLIGATKTDSATASIRQMMGRALSASISGAYSELQVVGGLPQTAASTNGHSVSGTAALQRTLGAHLNMQLGYTRVHQTYNVAAIFTAPDTNRESVSVSYQFSRPLGR